MANRPLMTPTSARPPRRHEERGTYQADLQPIGGRGPKLFYERYGMLENPFGVTPNPRYFYQSRSHAEARASLIIGLECGLGFQALIAPPGMGKTTILFDVLERFNRSARTAFLFQIQGDSRDFLRCLLSELGSEGHDSDLVHIQDAINQLLIKERRTGRRTIIIIDEAQSLDTSVLETVRLLSNFETPTEKLLQIVLAGQPQLAQKLGNPELAQLYQRISILTTLTPFDLEDTRKYIEHRLKIAGYRGPPLFTPAALGFIWKSSHGVPREINTLCFNALLLTTAAEQKQVDSDILHEVVADLELDRIRFQTDPLFRGMREVQTADELQVENETDLPAVSSDETRKSGLQGATEESGDLVAGEAQQPTLTRGRETDLATLLRASASGRVSDATKAVKTEAGADSTETPQITSEVPMLEAASNRVSLDNATAATPVVTNDKTGVAVSLDCQHFYNLSRNPFELTPDPSISCCTRSHRQALAGLYSGIWQHKGVIVLAGEAGIGKSLVVRCLMELLKRRRTPFEYLCNRHLSPFELLKVVAGTFGLCTSNGTKNDVQISLQNYFVTQCQQKLTAVLLVDDAQELSIDVLREIQLLTNLGPSQQKLLQIILIGRPELDSILELSEFRELKQRIVARCHIEPLDEEETTKYIKCRAEIAQASSYSRSLFRDDALTAACHYSRGIPRLINALCERALIVGHARQQTIITSDVIEDAAKQLRSNLVLQNEAPQTNEGETNELVEAMGTLLEFRARLRSMHSETGALVR